MITTPLPQRLLAWYGDDFTGSTDTLDVLASNGIDSVLFLEQPDRALPSGFDKYRAVGLAGISRSQNPEWMSAHLPAVFEWMRALGAPVNHYKVCSTFDSSPDVGSIGRALEIGQAVFSPAWVPIVVGAPTLRRYVVFGNLFATVDGATHRIDRHPTMSRHPVTPMHEADLRLHLARQTERSIALVDLHGLASPKIEAGHDAVLFDTIDDQSLLHVGRVLWDAATRQPFIVGSSGLEYALTAHWIATGAVPPPRPPPAPTRVDQIVALSGSCSPVTATQIRHAESHGFEAIKLDPQPLSRGEGIEQAVRAALDALEQRRSVVLYSAASPEDRVDLQGARDALGEQSGRVLCAVLDRAPIRRAMVAGGDTSSHAGRQLGIHALTFLSRIAPGAPLCRAWSNSPARDGLEIVFKGGQLGQHDFFTKVLGQ